MAQPPKYERQNDFQTDLGTAHGTALDDDFDTARVSINALIDNIGLIQRDDGELANASVTPDTLDSAVKALIAADWTVKGEWTTATAYVIGDLVEENNESYVCAIAHTSGTFATDDTAGKWSRLSGVSLADLSSVLNGYGASLIGIEDAAGNFTATDVEEALAELDAQDTMHKADLASTTASKGAALVGYKSPLTGGVGRTVQGKLEDTVSVFDFMTTAQIADVKAGTALVDVTSPIQAALDSGAKKIYFPEGTYKVTAEMTRNSDVELVFDIHSAIDATDALFSGNSVFHFSGSLVQIEELGANAVRGSRQITFASAPSLSVGDIFCIFNPTNSSWSGFRTNYFAGEWCEVEDVSGTTVTLKTALYDAYVVADVDVYRMDYVTPVLRNMHIDGDVSQDLVRLTLTAYADIEAYSSTHSNKSGVVLDRTFATTIRAKYTNNVGDGGDDYGLSIGGSQHTRVYGGNLYARRHAVTVGGGSSIGCVPDRDVKIFDAVISNDVASGTFAADLHGNTEDCEYIDCTIYGGSSLQGKNNRYVNCKIFNESLGMCGYAAEMKGGLFEYINCRFYTRVNPQTNTRGVIDFGGNSSPITADTVEDVTIRLRGCTFEGENLSGTTSFLLFRNNGATVKVNIDIQDLTLNVNNLGQIVFTDLVTGTADSDFMIVDAVTGGPSGLLLCSHSGGDYSGFPHRLQRQSGTEVAACTSGQTFAEATNSVTFRYAYPRIPTATIGISSTDGTAKSLFGGRVLTPVVYAVTATTMRPAVRASAETNFSSTENVLLHWTAEIREC